MKRIYLDNSATTPLCDSAREAMAEAFDMFGNPSSLHTLGCEAENRITDARRQILASIGVRSFSKITDSSLIFTGSGTEADNLATIGVALSKSYNTQKKIIISDSEHPAVLEPCRELEKRGFNVVRISTKNGVPDYEKIRQEADKDTILASFMLVNNETGAIYDIKRISSIIKSANPLALVHSDCVQAYMKIRFTEKSLGADLITLSAHKIGGPKGVGALYVSGEVLKKRQLCPVIFGGGQENGFRSGTENTIGILGFAAAVRQGLQNFDENYQKSELIKAFILENLANNPAFDKVRVNLPENSAPHILSITVPNIKSETLLHSLSANNVFVSSGSACSSRSAHKSHVLFSFGLSDSDSDCTIRVSLGDHNTMEDAEFFLSALEKSISNLVKIRR